MVTDIFSNLKFSDADKLTYSVLPHDCGVGEASWAGVCFSPNQSFLVFVSLILEATFARKYWNGVTRKVI